MNSLARLEQQSDARQQQQEQAERELEEQHQVAIMQELREIQEEVGNLENTVMGIISTPNSYRSPNSLRPSPQAPISERFRSVVNPNTQQIPIPSMNSNYALNRDAAESRLQRRPPRKYSEADV